jgi:hypothetical protein
MAGEDGSGGTSGSGGSSDTGGSGGASDTGGNGGSTTGSGGASMAGGNGGASATGGDGGSGMSGGDAGNGATGGASGGVAGDGVSGAGGSGGEASGGAGTGGDTSSGGANGAGMGGGAGTSGGTNLITNGDFSNDSVNWNTNGASANSSVTDAVWCGQFLTTGARIVLGWPEYSSGAIALSGTYTFSFKMSRTGNATILGKVGRAVSPYTTDFQIAVNPTKALTTFSYTFPVDDSQAGLAFDLTGNSPPTVICIDDVVLSPSQ